jgi:uncharacterized damage-inducible protein DinB
VTRTWTAPRTERPTPERATGERAALEQWLDYHRSTLLWKCTALRADQLKLRPAPPSRLSLLGLVRHMVDVERWWFRMHVAGEDVSYAYRTAQRRYAAFEDVDGADAAADLEAFRRECAAARAAVADRGLDEVVPSLSHDPEGDPNIRWIYVHMIEEYARHNGHADLLREAIDGVTGD